MMFPIVNNVCRCSGDVLHGADSCSVTYSILLLSYQVFCYDILTPCPTLPCLRANLLRAWGNLLVAANGGPAGATRQPHLCCGGEEGAGGCGGDEHRLVILVLLRLSVTSVTS